MTTAYAVALKETLPETSVAPPERAVEVVKQVPKFLDSEECAKRLVRRLNALLIFRRRWLPGCCSCSRNLRRVANPASKNRTVHPWVSEHTVHEQNM